MRHMRLSRLGRFKFSTVVVTEPSQSLNDVKPLIKAAELLKQPISLLLLSKDSSIANSFNFKQVFKAANTDLFKDHEYEVAAAFVSGFLSKNKFENVVMGNSAFSKEVLPRIAAVFDTQAVTDVVSIESPSTFKRPVYAGNAFAIVESTAPTKFIGIRPPNFQSDSQQQNTQNSQITTVNESEFISADFKPKLTVIENQLVKSSRPELPKAKVVLSGGRALKSADNFKLLYNMADRIGNCAVGASRAAVDAGYVSNDLQVGQTGKIVAPDLYVAFGISGAIQHVAGIKDSRVIVAVNNNSEAPIFQVADYGLVGDLFKVIPEMEAKWPLKH